MRRFSSDGGMTINKIRGCRALSAFAGDPPHLCRGRRSEALDYMWVTNSFGHLTSSGNLKLTGFTCSSNLSEHPNSGGVKPAGPCAARNWHQDQNTTTLRRLVTRGPLKPLNPLRIKMPTKLSATEIRQHMRIERPIHVPVRHPRTRPAILRMPV
jgi:hypothetical protein